MTTQVATKINLLSLLKRLVLSRIVTAFIEGIHDSKLRSLIIKNLTVMCDSLQKAYLICQETLAVMELEREIETGLARDREFEDLKLLVYRDHERSASSILAELRSNGEASRQGNVIWEVNSCTKGNKHQTQIPYNPAVSSVEKEPWNPERADKSNNYETSREHLGQTRRVLVNTSCLPPATLSRNPCINGPRIYNMQTNFLMYIKCGITGYMSSAYSGKRLEPWEQTYLMNFTFYGVYPTNDLASHSNSITATFDGFRCSWRHYYEQDAPPKKVLHTQSSGNRSNEIESRS